MTTVLDVVAWLLIGRISLGCLMNWITMWTTDDFEAKLAEHFRGDPWEHIFYEASEKKKAARKARELSTDCELCKRERKD